MSKDPTINIAELERLAKAATPGPWGVYGKHSTAVRTELLLSEFRVYELKSPPDAAFIASANPQTILTLIAALRGAKGALERIKGEVANGNMRFEADTTLHSIAEKVEGL